MIKLYVDAIASRLGVKDWQVENCADLLAENATVPFISRYRKERTGGLDDVQVAEVKHWVEVFTALEKRKETVLETISAAGKLTEGLKAEIEACISATELEDLYLPYRPKRRTRATVAREAGLEPLADSIYEAKISDPYSEARKFVGKKGVEDVEAALGGARDILAERLSETAAVRASLRELFRGGRLKARPTKAAAEPQAQKYRSVFELSEPLSRVAPHRFLAAMRAADEGFLSLKVEVDSERCCRRIYGVYAQGRQRGTKAVSDQINAAVDDAFKRLLEPSISGEVLREAKEKADLASIRIFGDNLRQLLLEPPVGSKRTLAIDPGIRTGCKCVCLDEQGNLLHHDVIYPHPPQSEKVKSIQTLSRMIVTYSPEVIAIGSGTAGRETEDFVKKVPMPQGTRIFSVSEDGASVYSASEVAREELPSEDVTVRGAVSIGRRLMDPLAELVKIDPKSLGVGQYQHDVDQNLLKEELDDVVESCVNLVGVNVNTASEYLLRYVSGIGPALARNICALRKERDGFSERSELMKAKGMGAKTFEQCAAFLRIPGASNPLDNSAVHPESYHIVARMASDLGVSTSELVGNGSLVDRIRPEDYVEGDFGLPTINDILKELRKPGRDPRNSAQQFEYSPDIHSIDDLKIGMELPAIITNITAFGAFADFGIKQNGLIHVSQMGVRGLQDPSKVLKLRQQVLVQVVSLDLDRDRIGLRLVK